MNKSLITQITQNDYLYSQWLHIKPRKYFAVLGIILLFLFVVFAAWILTFSIFNGTMIKNALWFVLMFLYFSIFIYLRIRKIKKIYSQSKFIHGDITIHLDEESYVCETVLTKNAVRFSDVIKTKSDDKMLLVYLNDCQFSIFPKNNVEIREMADKIESAVKNIRNAQKTLAPKPT